MFICYHDWKEFRDQMNRIEAKVDKLVQQADDRAAAKELKREVEAQTDALKSAIQNVKE